MSTMLSRMRDAKPMRLRDMQCDLEAIRHDLARWSRDADSMSAGLLEHEREMIGAAADIVQRVVTMVTTRLVEALNTDVSPAAAGEEGQRLSD